MKQVACEFGERAKMSRPLTLSTEVSYALPWEAAEAHMLRPL